MSFLIVYYLAVWLNGDSPNIAMHWQPFEFSRKFHSFQSWQGGSQSVLNQFQNLTCRSPSSSPTSSFPRFSCGEKAEQPWRGRHQWSREVKSDTSSLVGDIVIIWRVGELGGGQQGRTDDLHQEEIVHRGEFAIQSQHRWRRHRNAERKHHDH